MMTVYLDAQIHARSSLRKERYEKLKTPSDIFDYQKELKRKFLGAIGAEGLLNPPRSVEITGSGIKKGFRYENIIYETQPGIFVTAVLFLPLTDGPYPAVLVPCGHSNNGKAAETYQKASILLAMNGIAALCYDAIEQGERFLPLGPEKKQLSPTHHHMLLNTGAILNGTSVSMYSIREGMQGITYLQSRPDIDPDRIGVSGNSGGGTLTSYIMALDDRVKVAAPSCYLTTYSRLIETIGPQDAEQNIFGQMEFGLDHADYVHLRAPKPTLMLAATQDFFDITGTWDTYREAKRLYTRLGFPERMDIVETDQKHGFSKQLREGMVRWMRRWLMEIDEAVFEPEITILTDDEIEATPTGNVHDLPRARSSFAMNEDAFRERQTSRALFGQLTMEEKREKLREILAIASLPPTINIRDEYNAFSTSDNDSKLIATSEPGIKLPITIRIPERPSGLVELYFGGDAPSEQSGESITPDAADNSIYAFANVRGTGETATKESNWKGSVGGQWKDYLRAYVLGKTYVGMRVSDMQTCIKFIERNLVAEFGFPVRFRIHASGELTVPALHALFLDSNDSIDHLTLKNGIPSWEAILDKPLAKNVLINAVHGALKHYDLPDLIEAIPVDKLTIKNSRVEEFTP
jgi:dienelactone hydrolase